MNSVNFVNHFLLLEGACICFVFYAQKTGTSQNKLIPPLGALFYSRSSQTSFLPKSRNFSEFLVKTAGKEGSSCFWWLFLIDFIASSMNESVLLLTYSVYSLSFVLNRFSKRELA